MSYLLGCLVTPFYITIFFGILVFCQPFLMLCNLFSFRAFMKMLTFMNHLIIKNIALTAWTSFTFENRQTLPTDRPLLVVSNHQSMYDVPFHIVTFEKWMPRFISKVELSKGIPSISYALRNNGSAIIDRSDRHQAIPEIERVGRDTEEKKYALFIFPEGTRARDGKMKQFKPAGILTLLKAMPTALIVPVAITGSWKLLRYNLLPIPFGTKVTYKVLDPIEPSSIPRDEIASHLENLIRKEVEAAT